MKRSAHHEVGCWRHLEGIERNSCRRAKNIEGSQAGNERFSGRGQSGTFPIHDNDLGVASAKGLPISALLIRVNTWLITFSDGSELPAVRSCSLNRFECCFDGVWTDD